MTVYQRPFTCTAVTVVVTVVKAECVHYMPGWGGGTAAGLLGPQRRVPRHGVPAIVLDPVQVHQGVSRVTSVLNNTKLYRQIGKWCGTDRTVL